MEFLELFGAVAVDHIDHHFICARTIARAKHPVEDGQIGAKILVLVGFKATLMNLVHTGTDDQPFQQAKRQGHRWQNCKYDRGAHGIVQREI